MTEVLGRPDERAAIERFAAGLAERPMGLVIEGDAGIGKTMLVREAMRVAARFGYRVLVARPAEAEAGLSYAALADLIGDAFDEVSGALPPPQRAGLEVALLRRSADSTTDPRTTAAAVLAAITMLTEAAPVVLVVDDVQWLDAASVRALEYVVRRLPSRCGIVVAARSEEGPVGLVDLERSLPAGGVERLRLGPVPLAVLRQLLQGRVGRPFRRPQLLRIHEAAGGNPFYALEIAAALARSERELGPGDPLPVPRPLHDLLDERIGRLSEPAQLVAAGVAALSRPTPELLGAAFGRDIDVERALIEAEEAGLLTSGADRIQFVHPLLASAMYGSLTGTRRRSLHRRLAGGVREPEEQARHLARATAGTDPEAAARIEAAAELASRRGAPEAAAELYAAARRLTPDDNTDDIARRLLGGAQGLSLAGDLEAARSRALETLAVGREASVRARALLLLGDLATYLDTIEVRVAYQEQALREAGADPALRAEILLALFEQVAVDAERASRRADEAIDLLRARQGATGLARALVSKFIAEAVLGHGAQTALLDEALGLEAGTDATPAPRVRASAREGSMSAYPLLWAHWVDDLEAVRERFRQLTARFELRGDVVGAAEMVEFLAMAEFRAGNWDEAERVLEAACDTLAQLELRGPPVASFADRSVIDAHRGRLERARATLDQLLGVKRLEPFWRMVCHSAQGAVEFCGGRYEAADRAWRTMRDEARSVGWYENVEDRSEPDHIEALVSLGRLDDARGVLDHLEWRGRTLPRTWIDAGLPRARAMLLAANGHVPEALAVLDRAPATPSLPFEVARRLLVRGQLERRANRKLAAKATLTEALAGFERLGSPPWAARAVEEIGRLGLRHRGPTDLTEGERQIAELAARGMTNREVADAAFVSPKTVEANLARVYRKLGIRSRAELGARMAGDPEGSDVQT